MHCLLNCKFSRTLIKFSCQIFCSFQNILLTTGMVFTNTRILTSQFIVSLRTWGLLCFESPYRIKHWFKKNGGTMHMQKLSRPEAPPQAPWWTEYCLVFWEAWAASRFLVKSYRFLAVLQSSSTRILVTAQLIGPQASPSIDVTHKTLPGPTTPMTFSLGCLFLLGMTFLFLP